MKTLTFRPTRLLGATLIAALPLLLGARGGCGGESVPVGSDGNGVECGGNTCAAGEFCCNESCGICAPEGGSCIELACESDGGTGYQPCADKSCGDSCTVCPPNDSDCTETAVEKQCNAQGVCEAGEAECSYDPCAGKSCGDGCSLCPPDDEDCTETTVVKECNANGQCDTGEAQCGGGEQCGPNTCAPGQTCCNASCGICTEPGMGCTQQACAPDPCTPQDARSNGTLCAGTFGYAWTGTGCEEIVCGCAGADCDAAYSTLSECQQATSSCEPRKTVSGQCIRNYGGGCTTDADCTTGGCGGEVCLAKGMDDVSTCECGPPQGIGCGCVDGTCSWFE